MPPTTQQGPSAPADPDATIVASSSHVLPEVPGYDVTDHIGAGGMAHVWLATDRNLKRRVALKTMSAELNADPDFIARFSEEAKIVAGFRHGNIVTVFASGETHDQHYIAMEYIGGGTLTDRLRQGPLAAEEAIRIAKAIADALTYSHARAIVHRDLKPGNILFTDDGTPVLSDFGIAKSTETKSGLTMTGAVIGSPRYMAPEQMLGRTLTSSVDVYALGLVLFEMLTGDVPPPDAATVRNAKDAEALAKRLPGPRGKVADIITDCLRDQPDERPTASEVAARLQSILDPKGAAKATRFVAAAAAAALIGAVIVTQFTARRYELEFAVSPASANVYLDGQLLPAKRSHVDGGAHQLLVVDPGYLGKAIAVDADEDGVIKAVLTPLTLPSFDEFSEFNRLFRDDAPLDEITSEAVTYEPFQRLLALRGHQRRNEAEQLERKVNELNALAAVGDPAAQLILFVANFDQVIAGDRFSGLIQQASNSGYGLATFYQALHYHWAKSEAGAFNAAAVQVYRSLMALAAEQGLSFASGYVAQADDLLANPSD